ncbi:DUF3253 domain-containing protein [Mycobacterium sp. IS-3022]|uniref:DUF3253 domain-containing protein n=1 Tax=Mycobacterium sp. IS-3022 TaxID=1772277 RepID=UPI00074156BF|nr:DUF3253 domain-containing protein [Mycobacterium sp. IS-3022]KUH97341.1 S-adenosylmethionine tRNA ribosyltransferase [Mycobacterium sp. IS-3022]KUH97342.1 S-adenosylmethionine tRNA ribosyltransferase [Mycobacterium sp. IS-3022]
MSGDIERLRSVILRIARERGADKTIRPSDAARAVGGNDWRDLMDDARDVARDLARRGEVETTQKGEVVDPDATWRCPIRIRATPVRPPVA